MVINNFDFERLKYFVEWNSGHTLEDMMFTITEEDAWCRVNCEDYYILGPSSSIFASKIDAMVFKLRWL